MFFNFILSNGDRSQQRDLGETYYDHILPAGSHNRIRSVNIYYIDQIAGFSFHDKEGALLWKIGNNWSRFEKETVDIAENEVIFGVVAKLYPGY